MSVVVRCPSCQGPSRVDREAVGLLVACPRCSSPFVAVEESPPPPPPRRPDRPAAPPTDRPVRRRRPRAEPVPPPTVAPDPDPFDPHAPPPGGLPLSVMIGLALLPFVVPLLWLLAPLVLGQDPVLSPAAPVALAVAASALCLAVVYTVDWSPATRLKGVLMLVGLSYFAGVSLYFLKKEAVDRVKQVFGPDTEWADFTQNLGHYKVQMPGQVTPADVKPLGGPPRWPLECYKASRSDPRAGRVVYVVGTGRDPHGEEVAEAEWFAEARARAVQEARGRLVAEREIKNRETYPGREWRIELPGGKTVRVVRVFRGNGRTYYQSLEGRGTPEELADDRDNQPFFESFWIRDPKKD
jgi:hypothetical protein